LNGGEDRIRADYGESRLRLQTIVRLRWFAVLGQFTAISLVYFGFGYALPVDSCLSLLALSAWLNVFLRLRYPSRYRLSPRFATALLAYDILQLASLLYLTGGITNPFVFLIVAPVTVSAATLPPRNTILLGFIAFAAAGVLIDHHLPLPWQQQAGFTLPTVYRVGLFASVCAGLMFQALYAWRLSKESRQMSAALAASELVLAREQHLHALDGLAAAAAHELGTPLATIVLVTKELERELPGDSPHREDIELLRSQAQRCREILQKLTRSPGEQDPLHASVSVTELLEEAAAPYRLGAKSVRLTAEPAEDAVGPGMRQPIGERQPGVIYGIGNLIENAADFARSTVEVAAEWNTREVVVTVSDDGPGFPPDVMERLGEPYVTTRPAERIPAAKAKPSGLGLGFFIAQTLLERSGATVTLSNRTKGGAEVRITWGRSAFEEREPPAWPPAPSGPSAPIRRLEVGA